ncbi:MAG: hypothetical protein QNK23_01470 [Crocinitomicaceae bacterium]|nr:hypothetical protein [Crocinitomicaceae bacterium]
MNQVIRIIIIVALFVPYKMSSFSDGAGFLQDFLVIFVVFLIAHGVSYLVSPPKKKPETPESPDVKSHDDLLDQNDDEKSKEWFEKD